MNKIFNKLNNNLFKIGDNYVCISDEGIKKGDWVLEILNKVIFRAINEGNDYNNYSFKKVAFSTQLIHESIPVLDISTTDNIEELSDINSVGNGGIINYQRKSGFIDGYKKAKESFKYTDNHIVKAIAFGFGICKKEGRAPFDKETISFIQSLQQPKEIYSIEVEYEEYTEENTGTELKWINTRPVVLNGKIKCKINYAL